MSRVNCTYLHRCCYQTRISLLVLAKNSLRYANQRPEFSLKEQTVGTSKYNLWRSQQAILNMHELDIYTVINVTYPPTGEGDGSTKLPPFPSAVYIFTSTTIFFGIQHGSNMPSLSKGAVHSTHVTFPPVTATPPPLNSEKLLLNCTALRKL